MVAGGQVDTDAGRGRVLRDVLQRFEAAEVYGRLDVLAEPPDIVGVYHDRNRRLAGLRPQGRDQPAVLKQRRVNSPGQVAEVAERTRGVFPQLAEELPGFRVALLHDGGHQAQLDGQGHQVLLRSVVQVAFQP